LLELVQGRSKLIDDFRNEDVWRGEIRGILERLVA
jgi:hypothetical protein